MRLRREPSLRMAVSPPWAMATFGVHYQSDVEAGRMLGAAMVAEEHADPAFRADLAAARAELAKARTAPAACPA